MRADREKVTRLLKIARGQIDGIIKMAEDDRYCIEISTQISACEKALAHVNRIVLEAHLRGCVDEAFRDGTKDQKIEEIVALLDKMLK